MPCSTSSIYPVLHSWLDMAWEDYIAGGIWRPSRPTRYPYPALAILTESTLSHLGQEGARVVSSSLTRFWQAVGMLVGAQGRFGLRAKGAIGRARVKPQSFQLPLRIRSTSRFERSIGVRDVSNRSRRRERPVVSSSLPVSGKR